LQSNTRTCLNESVVFKLNMNLYFSGLHCEPHDRISIRFERDCLCWKSHEDRFELHFTDRRTNKQTDQQNDKETDRPTEWQRDRQTSRLKKRQTDRNKKLHKTDIYTYWNYLLLCLLNFFFNATFCLKISTKLSIIKYK
jgi:hypothetical protein